jgi:glucose/arabinose dehydrogenase
MRTSIAVAVFAAAGLLGGAAPALAQLGSEVVVSGLQSPVAFVQDPSNPAVQYVVEQGGRLRVVRQGTLEAAPFLDLTASVRSGGEQGLLGLAFPADYATSGRLYVNFTNTAGHTVVARFRRSANPLVADPASRFDLRWGPSRTPFVAQPFTNHNGGHLAFGPDGYLYIGLGDGGSGNDPQHLAQDPSTLLGKFLRIDVAVPDDHPSGYVVPPDNPFLDGSPIAALPEIWSFGLRNPWRYSFDDPALGGTGALLIGDVGQAAWEEINYEPPGRGGRNYGWRNREGPQPNVGSLPPAYLPLVDPVHAYSRTVGQSVTGGVVYRGQRLAGFAGRYFFADFVAGRVWSLALTIAASGEATASDVREHTEELGGRARLGNISAFGVDASGELYVVSYSTGAVLRVTGPAAAPPAPSRLRIVR